jgi:hypothetical protein
MRSHEWIDRRSLALHEAVAAKLEADPSLLNVARDNLDRWLRVASRPALLEWQRLLEVTPVPQLLALLRASDERAARLRQSSPFAGVLTPAERQAILDRHGPGGA